MVLINTGIKNCDLYINTCGSIPSCGSVDISIDCTDLPFDSLAGIFQSPLIGKVSVVWGGSSKSQIIGFSEFNIGISQKSGNYSTFGILGYGQDQYAYRSNLVSDFSTMAFKFAV